MAQLADHLDKLAKELERHRMPMKESMKEMNRLAEEARKLEAEMGKNPPTMSPEEMQKTADDLQAALDARNPDEKNAAASAQEKLKGGLRRDQLTAQERDALDKQRQLERAVSQLRKNDLNSASESLRQLGNTLGSRPMTEAERQAMANALQRMANGMTGSKEMKQQLSQAAGSLKQSGEQGQQQAAKALKSMPTNGAMRDAARKAENGVNTARQQLSGTQTASKPGNQNGQTGKDGQNGQNGQGGQNGQNGQPGGNKDGHDERNGGGEKTGNEDRNGDSDDAGGGPDGSGGSTAPMRDPRQPLNTNTTAYNEGSTPTPGRSVTIDTGERSGEAPGRSSVPYYTVYSDYQNRAESAIKSDQVPVKHRSRVRSYFDSLDPKSGGQ